MIGRRKFLERLGLGCLTAPLLNRVGDPPAERAPEPVAQDEEPIRIVSAWDRSSGTSSTAFYTAYTNTTIDDPVFYIAANDGDPTKWVMSG